jgi:hypothetical protein
MFCMIDFVPSAFRHQREILGQCGQTTTLAGGFAEQLAGELEISRHVRATVHLDGCNPHLVSLEGSPRSRFYSES